MQVTGEAPLGTAAPVAEVVEGEDVRTARVHHPSDLVALVVAVLATVLVLVLATYAQNTTTGVAEDVQGVAVLLRRILFLPVAVLESLVTLLAPLAVLTELALRRLPRQLLEALAGALLAVVLNVVVVRLVELLGSDELHAGLEIWRAGERVLVVPGYLAMLVGLLTVAGPRTRRRSVRWSWNALWVATGVLLVTAQASLPGIAVALLVGRVAGQAVRYASGVRSERAYGEDLLEGVRRTGLVPVRLTRVGGTVTATGTGTATGTATAAGGVATAVSPGGPARDAGGGSTPDGDPGPASAAALARVTDQRVYDLETDDGRHHDLLVMDGDRQVVGTIARVWRSLRLRGIEGRSVVSLRQAAERSALVTHAAAAAGVRTPRLEGLAEAQDSLLLVLERPGSAVALSELPDEAVTDAVLRAAWEELCRAHAAGLAHRRLTGDVVLVDLSRGADRPRVWLTGWDFVDVASSDLARRLDLTQLVALLALKVGATRAIASAAAVLPDADMASVGPLLQTITLPRETRTELRFHKEVLAQLRTELVALLPDADVEPEQLTRFGARTVLSILVTVLALFVVLTSINVSTITRALEDSDWRWSLVAFALGLVTLLGAALTVVAFSPVRLSVWRATVVQAAATFVALAAPAGVGPAALNLRMLTRRGVSTSLAAATVALIQVSQFVVTVVMLLVLSLATSGGGSTLPISPAMLVAVGVLAALVAAALLVPAVRAWAVRRILPVLRQTWPRLIQVVGQPWRLGLAVAGNLVMTLGYVFALDACLLAFGRSAALVPVTVAYLAGNTAGSLVPTPGGVGTVELALAGSLTSLVGVNVGIATSVAVLFRVLTYWLRVPIGWAAMRFLQRRGEL
ncbi:lysylphosphatidylglycerol synthase transmembrane domain-containing protein [Cellulomonas endophytica]|uniref:lysylphosphatidylglycerol synthase transmembrane domain-containing protein n=1 Tax=Cellulomonas endophytica TaxID=2494735 RepID=UPI001011E6CB|nr:lysylphosphatidylglycerol synthase transmembrane domain-containing protein [Cellulomonas endophytica]